MKPSDVTMAGSAIHNPAEPRHFMRIKPIKRTVTVHRDGVTLAETDDAVRVLEVGGDMYDPVIYFPADDVSARLKQNERTSHCPIKGDATYFDLVGEDGSILQPSIAWSYCEPFDFAVELTGRIAFYSDQICLEERPQ